MRRLFMRIGFTKEEANRIFWDWFIPWEIAIAILAMISTGFIHG